MKYQVLRVLLSPTAIDNEAGIKVKNVSARDPKKKHSPILSFLFSALLYLKQTPQIYLFTLEQLRRSRIGSPIALLALRLIKISVISSEIGL